MFDFVITFQNWLMDNLPNILSEIEFDSLLGSYYEYATYAVATYGVYLLYIATLVLVIMFVLGLVKTFYYIIKEFF